MSRDRQARLLAMLFGFVTVALVVVLVWDMSTPNGLAAASFEPRLTDR